LVPSSVRGIAFASEQTSYSEQGIPGVAQGFATGALSKAANGDIVKLRFIILLSLGMSSSGTSADAIAYAFRSGLVHPDHD
jgi:hypothetical protein